MFESFIERRNPGMPLRSVLWYSFWCHLILGFAKPVWRFRLYGAEHMPLHGGLVVIANHQSNLDPPLMAEFPRQMFFLAKTELFTESGGLFAKLIESLNAIPLEQSKGDTGAMKAAIAHLQAGRVVLIFAEGSRTLDGGINDFKPGAALLIRRARVPVLPVAIEGAFDVWKAHTRRPKFSAGRIAMKAGDLITYQQFDAWGPKEGLERIRSRVEDLRMQLRTKLRHETSGRFPPPGHGDFRYDDPDMPARVPVE